GAPPSEPPAHSSQTLDDLDRKIAQERAEGEAKEELLEKELQGIRTNLEKLELATTSSRETHNQTLHFMQQDAEREIKFFERKLHEDMTQWDKQLKDREKSIERAVQEAETGHQEAKASVEETTAVQKDAAERSEALLKEQEAALAQERQ